MFSLTWSSDQSLPIPQTPYDKRQNWTDWAEKLAEPFRSAYLSIAPSATFWCDRLAEWRTAPWDNRHGRVTMAGDAAHPMTYRELPFPPPFSCVLATPSGLPLQMKLKT